jgi:hypothetical protein
MNLRRTTDGTGAPRARIDRRLLAVTLVMILGLALIAFLFTSPRSNGASTNAILEQEASAQGDFLLERISALQSGEAPRAEALLVRSRELDELIPQDVAALDFASELTLRAQGQGLTARVSANTEATTDNATAFTISLTGPASAAGFFLYDLTNGSPLVTLSDVSLTSTQDSGAGGNVQIDFTAFAWAAGSPPLPQAGELTPASESAGVVPESAVPPTAEGNPAVPPTAPTPAAVP